MNIPAGTDPLSSILTKSSVFDAKPQKVAGAACLSISAHSGVGAKDLAISDQVYLHSLQRLALQYFLDNQMPNGLTLDRQANLGPLSSEGLCSTATTGMGFIALALAACPPHNLITPREAVGRILLGFNTATERLPHEEGIMPHFVDSLTEGVRGHDTLSTIDSAWFIAGALAAAIILQDKDLEVQAEALFNRVNWHYWTAPDESLYRELLRHGKNAKGNFLLCSWDRLNGETVFMYVLGAGAAPGFELSPQSWNSLEPFYGEVAGSRFCSADLGLFVFQYGLDLLDLRHWKIPGGIDLSREAEIATLANYQTCRQLRDTFDTFNHHWGLSAGDGPGGHSNPDCYRCYAPSGLVDGTAHLTATLASIAHFPDLILENLRRADSNIALPSKGRYGFSNVNHSAGWAGRDMVGIDVGAAMLALDNFLMENRVRKAFHQIPFVQAGIKRIGFRPVESIHVADSDEDLAIRLAS